MKCVLPGGFALPRFFFHFRDASDELLDEEGHELPSEALMGRLLLYARDCMACDLIQGHLDLRCRIDAHNEDGELVHSMRFQDAVEIIPALQGSPSTVSAAPSCCVVDEARSASL